MSKRVLWRAIVILAAGIPLLAGCHICRRRLRIDVTFHGEDGRTVTVAGDLPFRVLDERDVCSFQ